MASKTPSHRMQGLLGEFKKLYEGRLAKLKSKQLITSTSYQAMSGGDGGSGKIEKDWKVSLQNYEAQLKVYESYVKDLGEQNEVLVQTVEQLETEANDRVKNLEAKLNKAVTTAKECNHRAKNFELELQGAVIAKKKQEEIIADIQERYRRLESRYNEAEDGRTSLEHDLHALVTVISVARRTGRWQLDGVRLRQVDFNRVFGEGTPLKQGSKIEQLNAELSRKTTTISQLQAEIGAIRSDYDHLLDTMQSRSSSSTTPSDSTRPISELEVNVMRLKSEISSITVNRDSVRRELLSKQQQNDTLQREITALHGELSLKTDENTANLQNIASLERDSKLHNQQMCEVNSKCDEVERKLYDRTEMLKIEISRRDAQVKAVRDEINLLEEAKRSTETQLVEMSSEKKDAVNELKLSTDKVRRYENEIDDLNKELEKANKAYDSCHLESAQMASQIARLEAELTSLQEEHISTLNQLDKVSNGMQQLESTTRDKQQSLSNDMIEKQLELSTLRGKVAEYEKKLEDSTRECTQQISLIEGLKEDYSSSKSQLYTCQAQLTDVENRLTESSEQLKDTQTRLETANQQLQASRQSFDDMEQDLRRQIMEKEEALQDMKSKENNQSNKLTGLENQLSLINTQLHHSTQECGAKQQSINKQRADYDNVSQQLSTLQNSHGLLKKELADMTSELSKVKSDYEMLTTQHSDTLEENGKLEARVRALQINSQTENDSLAYQVKAYDDQINKLRQDKAKLQEQQTRQEEQCRKLHDKVEALSERNRDIMLENETMHRQLNDLTSDHSEKERKCSSQTQELVILGEQVHKLTTELKMVSSVKQDLTHNMSVREEDCVKQIEKISSLKLKIDQLHEQSHSYEVEVRSLQNQLLQVERKLDQKSKELERNQESNSKLQNSLAQQQLTISQVKQGQTDTKSSLGAEIKRLEHLHNTCRQELTSCRNQRDQYESELDAVREENKNVLQKLQQCNHVKQELEQSVHKYELELTVSQQKNKTCQQEVNSREAVILKLQEDLDHMEHKYTVGLEESNDKQESINSNKERIQKLEAEGRQLQITINKQAEEINNQAIQINELKSELDTARREVKRHINVIETLQDDMRQLRSAHTDEIRRYKGDIALVQDQLSVNREEVANLQSELNHQQGLTAEAENISEQWERDCEAARQQLSTRGELLSEMEKTLDQAKDEIGRLEMSLQQEKTKSSKLQQQVDILEQKLLAGNTRTKELVDEQKKLQDMVAECRANLTLRSDEISKLNKEAKNTASKMCEAASEVKHREELIDRLTHEITTLQEELTKSHDKLADYETNVQKLRNKLEQRALECSSSEERYRNLHNEFIAYKEHHQYDNDEVNERDERLRQQEDELHSNSIELSERNRQLLSIREEQTAQKSSISCLQDKIGEAESEVTRLEQTLKETRDELDVTRQRFHSEVAALEDAVARLQRDLTVEREAGEHLGKELQARDDLITLNSSECQHLQEQLSQRLEEVNTLEEQARLLKLDVCEREKQETYHQSMISQLTIDLDKMKADLIESREECKGYAQELAHHEEKRAILEQTLLTAKDQLRSRVSENVKQEQLIARLQTDMTSVREQNAMLEQEGDEMKQLIDRMETELNNKCKERDMLAEKESVVRLSLQRLQNDLNDSEDRYRRLDNKFGEMDVKLQSSHTELTKEQQKCRELERLLANYKNVITELQDDIEQTNKQNKENSAKLKERDAAIKKYTEELDALHAKQVVTKESLVEKEGQLRIALLNLETCEREKSNALQRLGHSDNATRQTVEQRDSLHEQLKTLESSTRDKDRELSRTKSDLASLQSNLNETIDQLNEKSKLNKQLKAQLSQSEKDNQMLSEENAAYEKKCKSMKQDIKKLQEFNSAVKADLERYERQVGIMHEEIQSHTDRNKQSVEEITLKEEELVLVKVECATLTERLTSKNQELERCDEDLKIARNSHRAATEEIQSLQAALDDARNNGDRLHKESEQVVRNVNGWVDEQKRANEKLASKLREQSDTIRLLQADKKSLSEEIQTSTNRIRSIEASNAELKTEQLKLKSLQEHSSRQQTLLRQLQNKLEEYEHAQDADMKSKLATIDDLGRQLQINTDNTNQLNGQINMMQKQNSQTRSDLERELANRHTLEATIEQKDELIHTLRGATTTTTHPGAASTFRGSLRRDKQRNHSPTRSRSPARNRSPTDGDSSNLDKSYWIQRVGELSMQLQQSSEYWSEKVGNLQTQLETSQRGISSPP